MFCFCFRFFISRSHCSESGSIWRRHWAHISGQCFLHGEWIQADWVSTPGCWISWLLSFWGRRCCMPRWVYMSQHMLTHTHTQINGVKNFPKGYAPLHLRQLRLGPMCTTSGSTGPVLENSWRPSAHRSTDYAPPNVVWSPTYTSVESGTASGLVHPQPGPQEWQINLLLSIVCVLNMHHSKSNYFSQMMHKYKIARKKSCLI